MTNANVQPVLYIDGRATKLLKPLVNKRGATYFAASKQAASFGIKVDGDALPNGLNTEFTVGVEGSKSTLNITMHSVEGFPTKRRGETDISLAGTPMVAHVTINDFGNGSFNVTARVTNPRTSRILTGDEVFV